MDTIPKTRLYLRNTATAYILWRKYPPGHVFTIHQAAKYLYETLQLRYPNYLGSFANRHQRLRFCKDRIHHIAQRVRLRFDSPIATKLVIFYKSKKRGPVILKSQEDLYPFRKVKEKLKFVFLPDTYSLTMLHNPSLQTETEDGRAVVMKINANRYKYQQL